VHFEPVVDQVLAQLAKLWFDIPDGTLIKAGGRPTHADELCCPFSFLAPSRYVFSSPNPRDVVTALAAGSGQRLLDRARRFVRELKTGKRELKGEISKALSNKISDEDLLARTLLGMVFGFVPTVYGNALAVLGQWLGDETLWRLRYRRLATSGADAGAALPYGDEVHNPGQRRVVARRSRGHRHGRRHR
jgi:hypothetical protein